MITLCMDTSHQYMGVALLKEDRILDQISLSCFKKQSELLLPTVEQMLKKHFLFPMDIGQIVISRGPGSYTGVRIAMCVAKVLGAMENFPVYTISTLKLYSDNRQGMVLIDARSNRAYTGIYTDKETFEGILTLDEVKAKQQELQCDIYGNGTLIGKEDVFYPIGECFFHTRDFWQITENIHQLVPEYLKDQEAYKTV